MSALARSPSTPEPKQAGDVFFAEVAKLLDLEWSRKESLEQRGLAVITGAGVIVTVLLATAKLDPSVLKVVPPVAQDFFILALLGFALSAVAGLVSNFAWRYELADPDSLGMLIEGYWDHTASEARRRVAESNVDDLRRARRTNGQKAFVVTVGLALEVAAIVCMCAGGGLVFHSLKVF